MAKRIGKGSFERTIYIIPNIGKMLFFLKKKAKKLLKNVTVTNVGKQNCGERGLVFILFHPLSII